MSIPRADLQQLSTFQDRLTSQLPPTIASATVITPTTFLTKISGTVAVSTINPPTDGAHLICLIFTDPAPAAFVTSGNILSAVQPVQNTALFLMFDPVLNKYCPATVPASGGTSGVFQHGFLVSGGQIVWTSNYNFTITAAQYYILGQLYSSPQTDITLDTAHATLDRIDIIAVTDAGTVIKITGTAAAQPSLPSYDPTTQLPLGFIFVKASTTAPVGATSTLLYAENAGGPGEWNWATSGTGFNVNSSADPQPPSTKSIEATAVLGGAHAEGTIPAGTLVVPVNSTLVLNIKSKAQFPQKGSFALTLRDAAAAQLGNLISIQRSGSYGFDSAQTASYQLVAIPFADFAVGANPLSKLRIAGVSSSFAVGAFFDNITIQYGAVNQQPPGLTVAEADARYLMLNTADDIGITVDGGGSVPATGQKGYKFIPYGFTIVGWALIADQVGSCVFDIWVDTYPNVPAVADTITAAAKPTLSAAQINFSTAISTWNKGPFLPDTSGNPRVVGYNLDSIATITRVQLGIFIKKING